MSFLKAAIRSLAAQVLVLHSLAAQAGPDESWQIFDVTEAGFSILLPKNAVIERTETTVVISGSEDGRMFSVAALNVSTEELAKLTPKGVLDGAVEGKRTRAIGQVESRAIFVRGLEGREASYVVKRKGVLLRMRSRMFVVGHHVYDVVMGCAESDPPSRVLGPFFDSFEPVR